MVRPGMDDSVKPTVLISDSRSSIGTTATTRAAGALSGGPVDLAPPPHITQILVGGGCRRFYRRKGGRPPVCVYGYVIRVVVCDSCTVCDSVLYATPVV